MSADRRPKGLSWCSCVVAGSAAFPAAADKGRCREETVAEDRDKVLRRAEQDAEGAVSDRSV